MQSITEQLKAMLQATAGSVTEADDTQPPEKEEPKKDEEMPAKEEDEASDQEKAAEEMAINAGAEQGTPEFEELKAKFLKNMQNPAAASESVKRTVKSKKIKEAAKVTASALIRKVMEQEMEPEVVINDYMDGEDDDLFVDAGCEDGDEICMQDDSILDPSIEVPSMNDGDEYGMEDDEIPAEEEDLIIPPEEEPMPEAEDEPPAMDDEEDDEVIEPSEKCKQKHGN